MNWVVLDVEADGPIPGEYSMVCFGAVVVEPSLQKTFYGQMRPMTDRCMEEAPHVPALWREGRSRSQSLAGPNSW